MTALTCARALYRIIVTSVWQPHMTLWVQQRHIQAGIYHRLPKTLF